MNKDKMTKLRALKQVIGRRIFSRRRFLGMSIETLSMEAEVGETTIMHLESAGYKDLPNIRTLYSIVDSLGMTMEEVFKGF